MEDTKRPPQGEDPQATARVRILATSDLHMNLIGHNYYSDCRDERIGFARTATLIRQARRQAERDGALTLLFDNGDSLQGTPLGDWVAQNSTVQHPLPLAFKALGYDAVGLGNHDFGFGLDFLQQIAKQSVYPIVCSNATFNDGSNSIWQKAVVLTRTVMVNDFPEELKIGVLSVLPPQTAQWEAHKLGGQVTVDDILIAAQDTASELRQEGCDLIVALAHTGLGPAEAAPGLENAAIPLAAVKEIDAVVAGHTHLTFPATAPQGLDYVDHQQGLVHGTPLVMPGFAGSHLGVIDLELARDDQNRWRICRSKSEIRAIHGGNGADTFEVAEDVEITQLLANAHDATRAHVARSVGRTRQRFHSYFAYCAPDRGLALLAAAQAAALRPFLTGTSLADLPVLSATAPAKFGGRAGPEFYTDIPAGDLSIRHVADLHVFPNELRGVCANGTQILDWLEMSAGLYNQLSLNKVRDLHDPSRAGHNLDIMHGLTYQIDLSRPARFDANGNLVDPSHRRVRHVVFNGLPIDPSQLFVVATNNYRANGGGNFPIANQGEAIPVPPLQIHDVLTEYLAAPNRPDPLETAPRPFSFASLGGVRTVLKTGPKARKYLDELAEYAPRDLGLDPNGFLRVQLTL
ncbi:MAG: bifunctional 2',3'-cyclic-nucleotide 2'-phosphodiesterase/3'-nucleotidase [Ruegeria sp.]